MNRVACLLFLFFNGFAQSVNVLFLMEPSIVASTDGPTNMGNAMSAVHSVTEVDLTDFGTCDSIEACGYEAIAWPPAANDVGIDPAKASNVEKFVRSGGIFVSGITSEVVVDQIFGIDYSSSAGYFPLTKTDFTICTQFKDGPGTLPRNGTTLESVTIPYRSCMYSGGYGCGVSVRNFGRGQVIFLGANWLDSGADWIAILQNSVVERPYGRWRSHILDNLYVDPDGIKFVDQESCEEACYNDHKCEYISYRERGGLCQMYDNKSHERFNVRYGGPGWRCAVAKLPEIMMD